MTALYAQALSSGKADLMATDTVKRVMPESGLPERGGMAEDLSVLTPASGVRHRGARALPST